MNLQGKNITAKKLCSSKVCERHIVNPLIERVHCILLFTIWCSELFFPVSSMLPRTKAIGMSEVTDN